MKDILGFENLYAVTKEGRIWSYPKVIQVKSRRGKIYGNPFKGKWLNPMSDKNGYLYVQLKKNKENYPTKVHRAVAQTYIPNPFDLATVNHKNAIKTDNRVQNLEWCSMKDNRNHARENKLYSQGETHHNATASNKQVKEIKALFACGKTQKEIALKFGLSPVHIHLIVRGKIRKYI